MKEAWEQAHDDAGVLFTTVRRDGYLLLSGALAGIAAVLCSFVVHLIAGFAIRRGPFAFFRWVAGPFTHDALRGGFAGLGIVLTAGLMMLLVGAALGIVFALIADRLRDRNSILAAGLAYGFAIFALAIVFSIEMHVSFALPDWELLLANMVFGAALVVQQPIMDLFDEYRVPKKPVRRTEDGPIRLPTLGPET